MNAEDDEQERLWEVLYDRPKAELEKFGREDARRTADSWIHDENWGTLQHKICIRNLDFFPGPGDAWPDMGLTIRAHEIVDGLQRQYFPKEFQDIRYEGSRSGTEND